MNTVINKNWDVVLKDEMKKDYFSPEFELVKYSFERTLEGDDDDEYYNIRHSIPQDIGEGSGVLD